MPQHNLFSAIYLSFFSRKIYQEAATLWGIKSIVYLLLIIMLSWIYVTYQTQVNINRLYSGSVVNDIIHQTPILTIHDGKIITPENHPYIITNHETKKVLAVIDTTGRYKTLEDAKTNILVTQTEVISSPKPNQIRIDKLPVKLNAIINPQTINDYLKQFVGYSWIPLFLLFIIGSFCYRLFQALVYSLIGKLFFNSGNPRLTYGQIFQISIVALTPTLVILTVVDFFGLVFPYQPLFYFLLTLCYVYFGIKANKSNNL